MTSNTNEKVLKLIDKKIKKLEKIYEFGKKEYHACPMHNIQYAINTLKELRQEVVNND